MRTPQKWTAIGAAACALVVGAGVFSARSQELGLEDVPQSLPTRDLFSETAEFQLLEDLRALLDAEGPIGLPLECFLDVSEEVQRECDRIRFRGHEHYGIARLNRAGDMVSWHVRDVETGEEILTSYPFGPNIAARDEDLREVRMLPEHLGDFLDVRSARPGSLEADNCNSNYNCGALIGWNNSIGAAPGQCFNFTTEPFAAPINNLSFSSNNTAGSIAGQTDVSATITGSYNGIKGSDSFSFSDQWRRETNSGEVNFNASSIYRMNNTVPNTTEEAYTNQGKNAGDDFVSLCGTEYMASVSAGLYATMTVFYATSSATASTEIANQFNVNGSLGSIENAVKVSNEQSNNSSSFTIQLVQSGGGSAASAAITDGFEAKCSSSETATSENEVGAESSCLALCEGGDANACNEFASNMAAAMGKAGAALAEKAENFVQNQSNLSYMALLPFGFAGTSAATVVTRAVPTNDPDFLAEEEEQLRSVIGLTNQISTLRNRASYLAGQVGEVFNPTQENFNIRSRLESLATTYKSDRTKLKDALGSCLAAGSDDVEESCSGMNRLFDAGITNAYEYYTFWNPNFAAKENSVALQYQGNWKSSDLSNALISQNFLYVEQLPTWSSGTGNPISGQAGFVGFATDTWYQGSSMKRTSAVSILPLDRTATMRNVYTSIANNAKVGNQFKLWFIENGNWCCQSNSRRGNFTSMECNPTVANPCPVDWAYDNNSNTVTSNGISNYFGD